MLTARSCLGSLLVLCIAAGGHAQSAPRPPSPPAGSTSTTRISIVATTDLHGGILPRGDRGGLALLGGYLRNLRAARAKDGGAVVLVDSGDMFQGTLESNLNEGAAVIRAYNSLGYSAAAIGNHEFDFGPAGPDATPIAGGDPRGALKQRAREARFPFLAANVLDTATGMPVAWPNVRPSTLITVSGIKIGLVGVTTTSTPLTTIADNIVGLTFAPLAPAIIKEATALRTRGAAVIVVMAHAGGRCTDVNDAHDTSSCDQMSEILDVVRALPAGLVDVIAAGHAHQGMAQEFSGVAVVEAFSTGRAFSRVDLVVEQASGKVAAKQIFPPRDLCAREDPIDHACDGSATPVSQLVTARYEGRVVSPDMRIATVIAPAVRRAASVKNEPLGVLLETSLRNFPQTESALSDLFADGVLHSTAGADVSIGNGGALRTDLPAGPLTFGRVYEVYPFDNRIVTLSLTGDELTRIVANNLERARAPSEILSIAGFRVDAACVGGMLTVNLTRPSGAPIRSDERLVVATSDFITSGGDGVLAPAGTIDETSSPNGAPLLRDGVIRWLRQRGGRLNELEMLAPENRRWRYPEPRPVRCAP